MLKKRDVFSPWPVSRSGKFLLLCWDHPSCPFVSLQLYYAMTCLFFRRTVLSFAFYLQYNKSCWTFKGKLPFVLPAQNKFSFGFFWVFWQFEWKLCVDENTCIFVSRVPVGFWYRILYSFPESEVVSVLGVNIIKHLPVKWIIVWNSNSLVYFHDIILFSVEKAIWLRCCVCDWSESQCVLPSFYNKSS